MHIFLAPADFAVPKSTGCSLQPTRLNMGDAAPDEAGASTLGSRSPNGVGASSHGAGYDSDEDAQYRSDNEEETKLVPNEPSMPRKITLKKKAEQANFTQWLTNNRAELSSNKTATVPSSQQEESLRYMVRSWEGGEKIIGQARDYQLELFERAKRDNTIAVLDTGKSPAYCAVPTQADQLSSRIRQDAHCGPTARAHHQRRARGPGEGMASPNVFFPR